MFAALKGARVRNEDSMSRKALGEYLWCMALGMNRREAISIAENGRMSKAVLELLTKTDSPAFSMGSGGITNQYSVSLARLIANLGPRGAFESMRADMIEVPFRTRLIVNTGVVSGSEVSEGTGKPVRRLSISEFQTEVSKFTSIVAITQEALRDAPEFAQRILADMLPEAVSRATDTWFLGKLQGEEVGESSGEVNPTWAQVLSDLEELMRLVNVGTASRLWFIMQPRSAKFLSRIATENGISTVRYDGGSIFGIPIVTSQGITSGRITLADASGVAYGEDGIEVRSSDEASVELSDAPTGSSATSVSATTLVSAFQAGFRVLLAERGVAVRVCDVNAVATLTGVQWGAGSDSPGAF